MPIPEMSEDLSDDPSVKIDIRSDAVLRKSASSLILVIQGRIPPLVPFPEEGSSRRPGYEIHKPSTQPGWAVCSKAERAIFFFFLNGRRRRLKFKVRRNRSQDNNNKKE